jgi:Tfp pilus assembly protein PilF
VIYNQHGKWDQAIEAFEKALSNILYDTPAYAHYNNGVGYYKKKGLWLRVKQYELALVQDPDTV